MRTKWEEQERERKSKTKEREGPSEFTMDSEVTPGILGGRDLEGGIRARYQSELRGRRLEMPIFQGENPDEWIFKAERYFAVNQLTEEEKIKSVALCFEATVLAWFQWESRRRGIRSWEGLKQGILGRFSSTQEEGCWRSISWLFGKRELLRSIGSNLRHWLHPCQMFLRRFWKANS